MLLWNHHHTSSPLDTTEPQSSSSSLKHA